MGEESQDKNGREDAQRTRHIKGVLRSLGAIVACCFDIRENPSANEGADFAGRGGDAVVGAADACGRGLCGEEANAGEGRGLG